jgi:hypothetical protein
MRNKIIAFVMIYTVSLLIVILAIINATSGLSKHSEIPVLVPVLIVISTVIPLLFIPLLIRPPAWEATVAAQGLEAPAQVKQIRRTGVHVGAQVYYQVFLEVTPTGEFPFEARIEKPHQQIAFLQPGQTVTVKYDPTNKGRVVLAPKATEMSGGKQDLATQVQMLADMHRRGDLSDEEFAAAKKKLIS